MKKILAFIIAVVLTNASNAQTIVPDSTFGINGKKIFTFFNNIDRSFGSVVQENNRIVIVGLSRNTANTNFELCFARFYPSGIIDSTFGTNGKTSVSIGPQQYIGGMTPKIKIDQQGRFVAVNAGTGPGGSDDIFMCRLDSSGIIDNSFNSTGSLFIDMTGSNTWPDIVNAFDFDASGNIYAVGATRNGGTPLNNDFAVVKITDSGLLDPTFDADGKKLFNPTNSAEFGRGLRVQPDGKIIIGGTAGGKMFLFRIDSTGAYDNTFNSNGQLTLTSVGSSSDMYDLTLDDSNRIVVGGVSSSSAAVVRLNQNGTYDTTFAGIGRKLVLIGGTTSTLSSLAIDSNNAIVFAGSNTVTAAGLNFYIARLTSAGVMDNTFNTNGYYSLAIGTGNVDDECESVSILPDGRYFLNGTVVYSSAVNEDVGMCLLKRVPPVSTGINTVEAKELDWSLHGNIVTDQLTVNCKKETTFAILTLDGKIISTTNTIAGSNTVNVSGMANGLYFLTDVSTGASKQFFKQ
jgi:uncharacterized delta-60 repeat protein